MMISREGYKLLHSKKIWMFLFFLLVMTVLMFFRSIGRKKEIVYVLLDETKEEREYFANDGTLAQDIVDLLGDGHHTDHNAGNPGYFWMTPRALRLFQEGGALYEKYKDFRFPERMVLQQMTGDLIGSPEEEGLEAKWKFPKMLSDFSAALWTAMIFTVFFFGMDFTNRGYQGGLFSGQKRRTLFFGKYMMFVLFYLLLSLAELVLAMIIFIPKIESLSIAYRIKGLFLRCLCDTGGAMLCVPFVFLLKSEWKAFGFLVVFKLLFMSNVAILNLDPYQFITRDYWKTCSDTGTTLLIGMVTMIIFAVSGFLSAELFQRAELK